MTAAPNPCVQATPDAVGLAMPSVLRCTSKGGLAVTPSAKALKPGCCGSGCATCK